MQEKNTAEVLLVDPDPALGHEIVTSLAERNYGVEWVDADEKAFNCLDAQSFDVLVTELNMHRVDGMRVMGAARERNPDICVIMITQDLDIELATEAMRQGAYDYQTKPLNMGKLEAVIERGLGHQKLLHDQFQLQRRLDERFGLGNLVGKSRAMIRAYNKVRQAAPSTVPIIVVGEPGTGKDHIAQAIHNNSTRRGARFVKLNCADDAHGLVKRDLLGHAPSAFPGTSESREGRIETADGGTLYLDRVSAFPQLVYEQVLDAMDTGRVQRLGEHKSVPVDFRLIVSVTPTLDTHDKTRNFLTELQSRFDALVIELPPLRNRKEDIPLLLDHFIRLSADKMNKHIPGMTRNAVDCLIQYDWPDNVREFQNTIEGIVMVARDGEPLDVMDIPSPLRRSTPIGAGDMRIPAGSSMSDVQRIVIEETLKSCGHNKEQCARTLGIGLRTLYRKVKEFDIR